MLKQYHSIVSGIFRTGDACIIGIAWLVAYELRFYFPLFEIKKGLPPFHQYTTVMPLVVISWIVIFAYMHVYPTMRILRRTDEVLLLLKAHSIATVIFITLAYLLTEYKYSRAVLIYFWILGGVSLVIFRLIVRNTLRVVRKKGLNLRHILAVGEGPELETIIQRIDQFPELGLRLIGIVTHQNSTQTEISKKPILGHFENIQELVQKFHPDQLLIVLPKSQYVFLDPLLDQLKNEIIDIQLVPNFHEYITLGCVLEEFDGFPIVNINDSSLRSSEIFAKRLTDILISLMLLIILAPLLIFIGILITITSSGPILYSQERMGLDGKIFKMLKFRSMQIDAEETTGAVWAKPNDQRRTKLGSFLRKTSFDELPQLWNVFLGDMSLVGPRPERPFFVHQFKKEIPHYMLRHKVKAGITGWAQVNGWRGNTSLNHRIEHDLYYIKNWSYFFDIKILFLTLWKGFINKNAY